MSNILYYKYLYFDRSAKTIRCVVEAFHAALESVGDAEKQTTEYKVEGAASKFFKL